MARIVVVLGSIGDQPTSTTTATTPTASPAATRHASRWPRNAIAMAAVNNGVAAFRSEVKPAGSVTVANEISVNGTAENRAPTTRKLRTRPRAATSVRRPKNARRTAAPMRSLISAAHTGPTSGAAMRKNKNAAPQTAPRNSSEVMSIRERARRDGGIGAVIPTTCGRSPQPAIAVGRGPTSSFDEVQLAVPFPEERSQPAPARRYDPTNMFRFNQNIQPAS
jgi:hypothetical protein